MNSTEKFPNLQCPVMSGVSFRYVHAIFPPCKLFGNREKKVKGKISRENQVKVIFLYILSTFLCYFAFYFLSNQLYLEFLLIYFPLLFYFP